MKTEVVDIDLSKVKVSITLDALNHPYSDEQRAAIEAWFKEEMDKQVERAFLSGTMLG